MSRIQDDELRVFPSMSQHGWCFVEDKKDGSRRGWVPGISCHFHLTYFNLEWFFTRNKRMQHSMSCRALSSLFLTNWRRLLQPEFIEMANARAIYTRRDACTEIETITQSGTRRGRYELPTAQSWWLSGNAWRHIRMT